MPCVLTAKYKSGNQWYDDLNPRDFLGQVAERMLAVIEGRELVLKCDEDGYVYYLCGTERLAEIFRGRCSKCNTGLAIVGNAPLHCPACSGTKGRQKFYWTEGHKAQTFQDYYNEHPEIHGKVPHLAQGALVWL
jgi:hypothetical protein